MGIFQFIFPQDNMETWHFGKLPTNIHTDHALTVLILTVGTSQASHTQNIGELLGNVMSPLTLIVLFTFLYIYARYLLLAFFAFYAPTMPSTWLTFPIHLLKGDFAYYFWNSLYCY